MALRVTLRKIRLKLQSRLGYGASDNPVIAPILNSFIDEAEAQLYAMGTFKDLESFWDFTVPAGSANVAYPVSTFGAMNPDKITAMKVNLGSGDALWSEVEAGIRPGDYNNTESSNPRRYERRSDGFEFSPASRDKDYTVRVFSMKERTPLENDDDKLAIDHNLVFALALAAGKSHYRHPDAQLYLTKANGILNSVRWQQTSPRIFKPAGKERAIQPKPVVV